MPETRRMPQYLAEMRNHFFTLNLKLAPAVIITISCLTTAAILVLDQASKNYIATHYSPNDIIAATRHISLVFVTNAGGVCGYGQQAGAILIILGIITNSLILFSIFFLLPHCRSFAVAFGCLLGGASGNLIDRLRFGYVVDFITLDILNWPSFNLADVSILGGIGLIGLLTVREMLQESMEEESQHKKWSLDRKTILLLIIAAIVFVIAYIFCIYRPFFLFA